MSEFFLMAAPLLWLLPLGWLTVVAVSALRRSDDDGRPPKPERRRALLLGLGWQALWTLPALVLQAGIYGGSLFGTLIYLYAPWLVHLGGFSVRTVFEATAKSVTGHRRDTLMDNVPYFALLTLVQMLVLALVFSRRYRDVRTLRDRGLLMIGGAVLVNALLNLSWPWWGT